MKTSIDRGQCPAGLKRRLGCDLSVKPDVIALERIAVLLDAAPRLTYWGIAHGLLEFKVAVLVHAPRISRWGFDRGFLERSDTCLR